LFPGFLSSWSCGMAGIPRVDMYGLGTVIDSFSMWVLSIVGQLPVNIQGVPGGMDKTSGGCSLG